MKFIKNIWDRLFDAHPILAIYMVIILFIAIVGGISEALGHAEIGFAILKIAFSFVGFSIAWIISHIILASLKGDVANPSAVTLFSYFLIATYLVVMGYL